MAMLKDIISEEEFNRLAKFTPSLPQGDSPGDSESDSLAEFEMGFDYQEFDDQTFEDVAAFDQSAADDRVKFKHKTHLNEDQLPASGKAVSSDLPSPRADREDDTSTH